MMCVLRGITDCQDSCAFHHARTRISLPSLMNVRAAASTICRNFKAVPVLQVEMPALSFGLGSAVKTKTPQNSNPLASTSQKRKNLFGRTDDDEANDNSAATGDQDVLRPTKSPKLFTTDE